MWGNSQCAQISLGDDGMLWNYILSADNGLTTEDARIHGLVQFKRVNFMMRGLHVD